VTAWAKSEKMATEKVLVESIDTARNAQVQFKIQVQEWKNTLLRGAQGQIDKYKAAFVSQSQKTQQLEKLSAMLPQLGMDNAQVEQTRKLHAELEAHYLSALQQYDLSDPTSAQRVDKLVTGIDGSQHDD
jgi:methyl-accepting chemotaxis protein-1 (serine sensor receptor)